MSALLLTYLRGTTNRLNGSPLTIYNELPSLRGQIYNVYDNYKQLNSDYNGMEFQARKQFHLNNAFVMAAFTIGRLSGRTTSGDLNNPNVLASAIGEVGQEATYQLHLNGVYTLPGHIKVSGNYQYLTGQPFTPSCVVNTTIDPGLTQLTQAINLVKPGSEHLPNLKLLDVRFSRPISVTERLRLEPMADLYSALNVNTPYSEVTTVGPNLGHYSANTEGRILKVGLKVDF